MTVKEIQKELPPFAKEMNRPCKECTLRFFYKKDKEPGIYEFLDEDCEEEEEVDSDSD